MSLCLGDLWRSRSTAVPHDPATNYDPAGDPAFDMVRDAVDDVMSHGALANLHYHFCSGGIAVSRVFGLRRRVAIVQWSILPRSGSHSPDTTISSRRNA